MRFFHRIKNGIRPQNPALQDSADYCDIADELLARVDRFLEEVQAQHSVTLSPVKWGPVSITSFLQ